MRTAVADTGPLNYLLLIGQIRLLPALFDTVSIPESVRAELLHAETPRNVREWVAAPPPWLIVYRETCATDENLQSLDDGEKDAIALAMMLNAALILMDDRAGVAIARSMDLAVTGTLGLLDLGARRGLPDLADAFNRLRTTSFRCRPALLDELLEAHRARTGAA